jgi:long-chain fatty acid transport protein
MNKNARVRRGGYGRVGWLPAAGVLFGVWLGWPLGMNAVGLRLPNQDPEAIARGNAFVATADNASAIYYNPAGITQLEGQHVQVGAYFLSTGIDYTSPTGETARTDSSLRPVPQVYYVNSLGSSRFSVGLGMYVPYGLALDWGEDNPFRSLVQEGDLLYLSFNPVVAVELHRTLSVGVGPTINYSDASLTRGIFASGDRFKFDGDGMGYGFNAGVRWAPHAKWALGANYRYLTTIEYDGTTTIDLPGMPRIAGSSSAEIRFPQFAVAGVSFRPTENWNFEVNVDWTDWDNLNEIVLTGVPMMGEVAVPLHYRSSWMYQFGATRKLGRGYALSAGYFFSENSSPDRNYTPLVPDSDLHLGSVGLSYRGARWNWAAAYHFGYNSGREVSGSGFSPTAPTETADGTYRVLNHAFNVSAALKF